MHAPETDGPAMRKEIILWGSDLTNMSVLRTSMRDHSGWVEPISDASVLRFALWYAANNYGTKPMGDSNA